MDLAVLGIEVRSTEVERANRELDKMPGAAKRAEAAAKGLGTNASAAAKQVAAANDNMAASYSLVEAVVGRLTTVIGRLVGPAAIGSAAIYALSAAFEFYKGGVEQNTKTLDETIDAHTAAIRAIKDAYGEGVKGLDDYAKKSQSVLETTLAGANEAIRGKLSEDTKSLFADLVTFRGGLKIEVNDIGLKQLSQITIPEVKAKFASLSPAIAEAAVAFQRGEFSANRFQQAIGDAARIDPTNAALQTLASSIIAMLDPLASAEARLAAFTGQLSAVGAAASGEAKRIAEFTAAVKGLESIAPIQLSDRNKAGNLFIEGLNKATNDKEIAAVKAAYADSERRLKIAEDAKEKPAARAAPRASGVSNALTEEEQRYNQVVSYIANLERAGRVLEAEVATIGKSNAERQKAIELARIGSVTDKEQLAIIDQQVAKNEELRKKLEDVKKARQGVFDAANFAGGQLLDVLDGMIDGTKTLEQSLQGVVKALIKAALQAAILGQGPLAGIMGMSGSNGAPGGLIGSLVGAFLPGKSDGGYTGNGARTAAAGIVHGQEYVFSAAATKRIGVGNLEAMHRSAKGYADGGYVGPMPAVSNFRANDNRSTAAPVTVNVINNAGADVKTRETTGADGSRQLEIMVDQMVANSISQGSGRRVMERQYGMSGVRGR
jgi:hypothetical protein